MKALFIDTEVSSLETKECVQLAWRLEDGVDRVEDGVLLFRPSADWEYGAIATHHILPCDVKDCQPSTEAAGSLPDSDCVIGHNIDFDCEVLGGLPGRKRICTLAMARAKWPELSSHKLTALAYMVMGPDPEVREIIKGAHDASTDVRLCREVLHAIVTTPAWDWEAIYRQSESDRIPKKITFGKHSGAWLKDLPSDYVKWLLKLEDLDPYLRKALTR